MEMYWNLDNLYKSFKSEKLLTDVETIGNEFTKLITWCDENFKSTDDATKKIKYYLEKSNQLSDDFITVFAYGKLSFSVDTSNQEALQLIEKLEKYFPIVSVLEVKFSKWVKDIKVTTTDKYINDHLFLISEAKKNAKYMLSDAIEEILANLRNTGSGAWSKLQDMMVSTLSTKLDDKDLPLPALRNLAYDASQEVRKKAYEAELTTYKKIEKSSAASLNAIKGEVIYTSKLRGYKTPLEMTLIDSRMDKETLDAMISSMREYLPHFRRYLRKKASLLGHEGGLPFYDLFAPMGKTHKTYTFDEASQIINKNFSKFSSKLGAYSKKAFDNNWIDAKMRDGKVGGAFCASVHGIKESRILANFSGSFSDVTTLAHELGHGYHGECLKDVTYLNSNYSMPMAETASIFCESYVVNATLEEATDDEKFAIVEHNLVEATQVIVDILSRYEFETKLFELRKTSSVPVEKLKELMIDAQLLTYGDGLDSNTLHPYMWACKPHYYSAGNNFYNFPYAFGLLFAKGLYAQYLIEGNSFIPKYDKLLVETGKNDVRGVLASVGIDSSDKTFWRNSLELIKKDVDYFVNAK
ncbi:MAG: M3 family oligoendopeptidase [Clostridiales bacterium]|nr:M3 family oligoendopeptidase [Clostridiales bacterium]